MQKKDDPTLEVKDLEEAFSDHDKDGSGTLSLSEWQQPFEETVQSMLNDGDPDEESEEDRIAHHRQEFNSYDTNADGYLDQGELDNLAKQVSAGHAEQGEAAHGNVSGAEVMQALDIDADGKVTFEVPPNPIGKFLLCSPAAALRYHLLRAAAPPPALTSPARAGVRPRRGHGGGGD